jgi:hypothetical protein
MQQKEEKENELYNRLLRFSWWIDKWWNLLEY